MRERLDRGGDGEDRSKQPVAYVISAVEGLLDESAAKRYAELAGPAIEYFGGRFIVSNTELVVVEGESPSNHLSMVEFPSMEEAKAWYNSSEYAEARALTPAAFRGRLLIFAVGVEELREPRLGRDSSKGHHHAWRVNFVLIAKNVLGKQAAHRLRYEFNQWGLSTLK